jgi:hypothetical protein
LGAHQGTKLVFSFLSIIITNNFKKSLKFGKIELLMTLVNW